MKINPFIFSQVGEKQNETVLAIDGMDKDELTEYLYSFYDQMKEKTSFFRMFRMKRSIVAAYYWSTDIPEVLSERRGLCVVLGFLLDDRAGQTEGLEWFSRQFFETLEKLFKVSLDAEKSDDFFRILQGQPDEKLEMLRKAGEKFREHIPEFGQIRNPFSLPRAGSKKRYIYMLNKNPDFCDSWNAFCREALNMIGRQCCWDISTLEGFTPQMICILENGSKIERNFGKVWKVDNGAVGYLVME